jgi:AcrR family transcriptional regulator
VARIPAARRRELLAEAALRVLSRDGLAGVTTRAVVAEAGMSLASFHYAYQSREELLGDLIAPVVAGEREAGFVGALDSAADVHEVLRRGLDGYLALLAADPGREQGMFELTQYALRTPALAHLAAEQYARYHALAADLLDYVGDRFEVRWDQPVPDMARFLVALTDGITLSWLADRDGEATRRLCDLAIAALLAHAVSPVGAG